MKRIISLLLLAAMLGSALVSCSQQPPEETKTRPVESTDTGTVETDLKADIPSDVNYNGYEFRILNYRIALLFCPAKYIRKKIPVKY